MIKYLRKQINKSTSLKKILLPMYLSILKLYFWTYKIFNFYFSYTLINKSKIKFYPKGQLLGGRNIINILNNLSN